MYQEEIQVGANALGGTLLVEGLGRFHVLPGTQDRGPWQKMLMQLLILGCIPGWPLSHPVHCIAMLSLGGQCPLWILWGLWDFLSSSFIITRLSDWLPYVCRGHGALTSLTDPTLSDRTGNLRLSEQWATAQEHPRHREPRPPHPLPACPASRVSVSPLLMRAQPRADSGEFFKL